MSKSILSSDQTHTLHHTFYEPNVTVNSTLLIVHGMAEHSQRYASFAKFLSNYGIAVLTYDHLGHGRSINSADELGFFDKKHPAQTLLKDVDIMAKTIGDRYPEVPHFIMGHSMGSFIVRTYLQTHSNEFDGAILMGTSDYDPLTNTLLAAVKVLNRLHPRSRNPFFANMTNKILNSKLNDKKASSKFFWIVRNAEALQEYLDDPLTGFDFTNNGFYGLFSFMKSGLDKNWAETIDRDFPMLFVSGEDDPVGNMGKGITNIINRLAKQGFKRIDKHLYPTMRHEPLNEVNKEQVYKDILNWIQKII